MNLTRPKIVFWTILTAGITTFGANAMETNNTIAQLVDGGHRIEHVIEFLTQHQDAPTGPITGNFAAIKQAMAIGDYDYIVTHLVEFGNSSLAENADGFTLLDLALEALGYHRDEVNHYIEEHLEELQ